MRFQRQGIIILKPNLKCYDITEAGVTGYSLYHAGSETYWDIPRQILEALPPTSYVYVNPSGEVQPDEQCVRNLGWDPDKDGPAIPWLILYIKRLEGTSHASEI